MLFFPKTRRAIEMDITKSPFWEAFSSRADLKKYGVDSLLLFALQLKFDIEDIDLIASNCLTEGGEDKKTDLVYINSEAGYVVIAQTSVAESVLGKNGKPKTAKANKATDLNAAISWLLAPPISDLPEKLKSHAKELRQAILDGEIDRIYIWLVHNLQESSNVADELKTVGHTTASHLKAHFPSAKNINIQALEVGKNTLERWYQSIQNPILVPDIFTIPISNGFKISEGDWKSFVTTIPAAFLFDLYKKYENDLFSADIRDYLGSRGSDKNINSGIKQTAQNDPEHFWVYNNGITVLVNKFKPNKTDKPKTLQINGFSIINGAQTTGSIGNLKKSPIDKAMVQVRFITCNNQKTLRNIVKFNNTQNKILGPDSRSNDDIQTRLISEFKAISGISYLPRRGEHEDITPRPSDRLYSVVAGQSLAAFFGNPDVAYHEKTNMWIDNKKYSDYFNDHTNAKNILFALSLLKAVENKKRSLWEKSNSGKLIGKENDQFNFFRNRGAVFMMTSAIAGCLEDILDKQIPSKFDLAFKKNLRLASAIELWVPIVNIASAFPEPLVAGLADGFKAHDTVNDAIKQFQSLIRAIVVANPEVFVEFRKHVN
jgi:hypothetical protein